MFTQKVAEHGRQVLEHQMQVTDLPEPRVSSTEEMMTNLSFFQANPFLCAAYIQPLGILEVYTVSAACLLLTHDALPAAAAAEAVL